MLCVLLWFFEKQKLWPAPNPHLLPLPHPGFMAFPQHLCICGFFYSKQVFLSVIWIYHTLILQSRLLSPSHPPRAPSSFWKAGLFSATDGCILPSLHLLHPDGRSFQHLGAKQSWTSGSPGDCSLYTLLLWGTQSEGDRSKKKDPTDPTEVAPVFLTFKECPNPEPHHGPFGTQYLSANFANWLASVKVKA